MATKRITEFLDGSRTRYVLLIHSPAFSAQEVAESVHLPGRFIAKTVIVKIDGRLAMAVVPATMDVDLLSLKEQLGARRVELADELEFADRFRGCQLGTAPPFGRLFGIDTYGTKNWPARKASSSTPAHTPTQFPWRSISTSAWHSLERATSRAKQQRGHDTRRYDVPI